MLSGFLITTLLLREFKDNGRIALSKFYARRTLRIFPAFYFYLLVLFAAASIGLVPAIGAASWVHALTYTMDYVGLRERPWNLGHLWSLAVEEQFYLLWPTAVAVVRPRRAMWVAAGTILLVPAVRFMTWHFFPAAVVGMKWQFHTVCDALATGCLLAGIRWEAWDWSAYRNYLTSRLFVLVPIAVLVMNRLDVGRPRFNFLIGQTVMNVGIALCIDWVLRNDTSVIVRVLELPGIVLLGTLSYSIYLGSSRSSITRRTAGSSSFRSIAWPPSRWRGCPIPSSSGPS